MTIRCSIRKFGKNERGVAAVEMALFAPVLALMLLGGFDVSRFVSIRNGVDKVGFSVADVTSQYQDLSPDAMKQIFLVTGASMTSYVSGQNGATVLTSIYKTASGQPKVRWQCASSPTSGTFPYASKIGSEGGNATVDASLIADVNDNLMVAEVFYRFNPVFSTFFKGGFPIYTASIYRPRLGSLTTKPC